MNFSKKSKIHILGTSDEVSMNLLTPHNCNFYILPPLIDISLQEFEDLAIERLKVLRILEGATQKNFKVYSDEWKEHIINELNLDGLKHFVRLCKGNDNKEADLNARRRDYISHFILRFAYCRSEELRRWFVSREMELFRLKFSGLNTKDIKDFLEVYEMDYKPLSEDQKSDIKDRLLESTSMLSVHKMDSMDFYKVKFLEVLDLVKTRRCFLKDGYAYVSTFDFVSIIGSKHQHFIENGLQSHLRLLPEIQDDERLFQVIKGLHTSYLGKDYTINKDADVPIESLDQLSLKSYPICMRYCHETLRTKHHLKHGGRLQYGLFLKGIGVTMEDSLRFWREEFSKMMEPDKFDKAYAYGIRYNYGKEGSKTNWTPYSCMKIITSPVAAQDTCGCPFKNFDPVALKSKLSSYGLSTISVQEVMSYVTKGHFQLACARYFEVTHDLKLEEGITHPNQYFELSQVLMGQRQPKNKEKSANPQQNQFNNRRHAQMSQQQAFKDKFDRRARDNNLNNTDYDDELWKLSQAEEEMLNAKKTKMMAPPSNPSTSNATQATDWGEEDDEMDFSQAEELTLSYL